MYFDSIFIVISHLLRMKVIGVFEWGFCIKKLRIVNRKFPDSLVTIFGTSVISSKVGFYSQTSELLDSRVVSTSFQLFNIH